MAVVARRCRKIPLITELVGARDVALGPRASGLGLRPGDPRNTFGIVVTRRGKVKLREKTRLCLRCGQSADRCQCPKSRITIGDIIRANARLEWRLRFLIIVILAVLSYLVFRAAR
jgi:hypothetical protein